MCVLVYQVPGIVLVLPVVDANNNDCTHPSLQNVHERDQKSQLLAETGDLAPT